MTGPHKLLRTSTFRLAALYLILFAVSVSALLGYVYWNTAVLLQEQTDYTIQAEVQGLADQYRLRGLNGILDTVQRRSSNVRPAASSAHRPAKSQRRPTRSPPIRASCSPP